MSGSEITSHDGLGVLDFVMVSLYLLLTFGIALYFARQKGSTEEFFLGGRSMPWFAVGLSIIASLLSTISYLATPGEMIKHGIGFMGGQLSIPFSMVVVFFLWQPFFMRMRLTSAYEYLERRFESNARLLAVMLFLFMRLGWMGVVVYTSSEALTTMLSNESMGHFFQTMLGVAEGPDQNRTLLFVIIALVGLFATIYTTVGGIRAVIWTDVVQFVVLFFGAVITLGYVAYATGSGPSDWFEKASQLTDHHTSPPLFSFDITVRMTVIGAMLHTFFWVICTHASDQVVLQRYFSTSSLRSARLSFVIAEVASMALTVLLVLCGFALLFFYLRHADFLPEGLITESPDKVFPYFISHQLPPGLGGLILAALIAAAMSSIDSGVNSVSAVITTDVFKRYFPNGNQWIKDLTLARVLTLVVGAMATGTAYLVVIISQHINIMELMAKAFNMFLGPLAALFFIGMFLPRCTSRSAIPGVAIGMTTAIVWSYWKEITGFPPPTFTLAIAVPCLSAFLSAAFLSLLVEKPGRNLGADYTWLAVMRRPPEDLSAGATDDIANPTD